MRIRTLICYASLFICGVIGLDRGLGDVFGYPNGLIGLWGYEMSFFQSLRLVGIWQNVVALLAGVPGLFVVPELARSVIHSWREFSAG